MQSSRVNIICDWKLGVGSRVAKPNGKIKIFDFSITPTLSKFITVILKVKSGVIGCRGKPCRRVTENSVKVEFIKMTFYAHILPILWDIAKIATLFYHILAKIWFSGIGSGPLSDLARKVYSSGIGLQPRDIYLARTKYKILNSITRTHACARARIYTYKIKTY